MEEFGFSLGVILASAGPLLLQRLLRAPVGRLLQGRPQPG